MRTSARGIRRPSTLGGLNTTRQALTTQGGATLKEAMATLRSSMQQTIPLDQRYFCTNSEKWDPNNFFPTLLGKTGTKFASPPLLDNTHTPRGAKKAITLERAFDRVCWMHNRTSSEGFDQFTIKRDQNKSKMLKKIRRAGSRTRSRSKSKLEGVQAPAKRN